MKIMKQLGQLFIAVVELAVAMFILGLMGLVGWAVLPDAFHAHQGGSAAFLTVIGSVGAWQQGHTIRWAYANMLQELDFTAEALKGFDWELALATAILAVVWLVSGCVVVGGVVLGGWLVQSGQWYIAAIGAMPFALLCLVLWKVVGAVSTMHDEEMVTADARRALKGLSPLQSIGLAVAEYQKRTAQ